MASVSPCVLIKIDWKAFFEDFRTLGADGASAEETLSTMPLGKYMRLSKESADERDAPEATS